MVKKKKQEGGGRGRQTKAIKIKSSKKEKSQAKCKSRQEQRGRRKVPNKSPPTNYLGGGQTSSLGRRENFDVRKTDLGTGGGQQKKHRTREEDAG